MSDDVQSVMTPYADVAELGQGYMQRADGERLWVPLPSPAAEGEDLRFVIHLADGTPAFAGTGRCVQVADQGEGVESVIRYEALLDSLQFDERSQPVYDYIVAVRSAALETAEAAGGEDGEGEGGVEADADATEEVAAAYGDEPSEAQDAQVAPAPGDSEPYHQVSEAEVDSLPPDPTEEFEADEPTEFMTAGEPDLPVQGAEAEADDPYAHIQDDTGGDAHGLGGVEGVEGQAPAAGDSAPSMELDRLEVQSAELSEYAEAGYAEAGADAGMDFDDDATAAHQVQDYGQAQAQGRPEAPATVMVEAHDAQEADAAPAGDLHVAPQADPDPTAGASELEAFSGDVPMAPEVIDALGHGEVAPSSPPGVDVPMEPSVHPPEPIPTGILMRPAIATHWRPEPPRKPAPQPASGRFQYAAGELPRPAGPPRPALDPAFAVQPAPHPRDDGQQPPGAAEGDAGGSGAADPGPGGNGASAHPRDEDEPDPELTDEARPGVG